MVDSGTDVVIGGESRDARNIVSGNFTPDQVGPGSGGGIWILRQSVVRVVGNYVGVAADGITPLPNWDGVEISADSRVELGGTAEGAGNVIAGNRMFGVVITPFPGGPGSHGGPPPQPIAVRGNQIGAAADGAPVPGQPVGGVLIQGDNRAEVGGVWTGAGNTIAGSENSGVSIRDGRGGRVLGNMIYANGMADINLGVGPRPGPTPNDPGDLDDGPNDLQNYPVIERVQARGERTTIAGSLDSRPDTTYRVELFAGTVNPSSGRADARRLLGAADITTDANGIGVFAMHVGRLEPGEWVSATATGPESGTSELSEPVAPASRTP